MSREGNIVRPDPVSGPWPYTARLPKAVAPEQLGPFTLEADDLRAVGAQPVIRKIKGTGRMAREHPGRAILQFNDDPERLTGARLGRAHDAEQPHMLALGLGQRIHALGRLQDCELLPQRSDFAIRRAQTIRRRESVGERRDRLQERRRRPAFGGPARCGLRLKSVIAAS